MTRAIAAVVLLALAACGTPKPASDSTAVLTVDTMKAAAADSASLDSTGVAAGTAPVTKAAGTKAATGTATKADSLKQSPKLGRDSVIKPIGRMPAMDTATKRP